jgi:undecaprenyl-diphosphatase
LDLLQLIVLAIVQGITEFLPISSSAHLVLVPSLTGWRDQGVELDVATHLGTLLAVLVYFRREAWRMSLEALGRTVSTGASQASLLPKVLIATIPVIVVGFLVRDLGAGMLRDVALIAWMTIAFGILLYVADRRHGERTIDGMSVRDATLIGLAQTLALLPGVSRAGVTITAARFLGYSRAEAARFSLLLSIPTILAAATLIGYELHATGNFAIQDEAWLAAGLAFVAALLAIGGMMSWLRQASFTPFVIYRVVLGFALLVWLHVEPQWDGSSL